MKLLDMSIPPETPGPVERKPVIMILLVLPASLPVAVVLDVAKVFVDLFGEKNIDADFDGDSGSFIVLAINLEWLVKGK